ncbi:hypothetical protein PG997_002973 [Apiospora hydei]|uniref:Uncharacterized protein n=1 Tax=Apiospora hydei TaxID=1337664 RepID=A0ABR1WXY0_9PEZI
MQFQAPAVMDSVEGSGTSEDYTTDEDIEMTEDGESSEENGSEYEFEWWENREDIAKALLDHGTKRLNDKLPDFWGNSSLKRNTVITISVVSGGKTSFALWFAKTAFKTFHLSSWRKTSFMTLLRPTWTTWLGKSVWVYPSFNNISTPWQDSKIHRLISAGTEHKELTGFLGVMTTQKQSEPTCCMRQWPVNEAITGPSAGSQTNQAALDDAKPPMDSTGKKWADKDRVTEYLQNLDTLMSSGYMGVHSQINNSPTQTYTDSLAQLLTQDDQPGTRSEIFGPEHLRAFHWNNTRNHPTPLSYAMNHFVSVDLPDQADDCHMASLRIAFHLIRKGADPRRVDPEVRRKVQAEYQRRAAADLPPQPKQRLSRAFCRDNMAGMTAQHFCENSGSWRTRTWSRSERF